MPLPQSRATTRALAMIGKRRRDGRSHTAYSAAKLCGISLSTIYRALERQKKANGAQP